MNKAIPEAIAFSASCVSTAGTKAYALTNGSETSLFLNESDALAALKLKEILVKKSWRVVELVEVKK